MVALLVILSIAAFITADVLVRIFTQRLREKRLRQERAEALDIGLRLDCTDEATTLKRVTVDEPKARILAVDDEAVILDSFRKILVLAGYSVDTVEKGPEAVGLIKKNDYDFVFTDLKMPDFDGLDVVKAVKHLRPDIDVIMITGYATIESAVDSMKFGALDYVQKPFTEEELVDFVNKSLIRRQDKIERQKPMKVHLVTPSSGEQESLHVLNVPAGLFVSQEHAWVNIEPDGSTRIGLDDFTHKVVGHIDSVDLPQAGQTLRKGETAFSVRQGSRVLKFPAPMSGKVTRVNTELAENINLIGVKPYELGWLFCIEATNLSQEMKSLMVGADAVSWYQNEIDRFRDMVRNMAESDASKEPGVNGSVTKRQLEEMGDDVWDAFSKSFLHN